MTMMRIPNLIAVERQYLKNKIKLELGLQAQKNEAQLFWKRSAYFSLLLGVLFAALCHAGENETLKPMLLSLGFLFSLGWVLASMGSKYWQENWEQKISEAESRVIGPFFKSRMKVERSYFVSGNVYSISKVAIFLSFIVWLTWTILLSSNRDAYFISYDGQLIYYATLFMGFCMLVFCRSSK
jgi:hypothetical protein